MAQSPSPELNLVFPSDPIAVRNVLASSLEGLRYLGLSADERGVVEIVLAEVLNNIVEHAHQDCEDGVIELRVSRSGNALQFCVIDDGIAFPDEELPPSKHHDLNVSLQNLPEGGFGWMMIRELTRDLRYTRTGIRNQLNFSIALEEARIA